jgi:hypothetical protein
VPAPAQRCRKLLGEIDAEGGRAGQRGEAGISAPVTIAVVA